MKNEPKWDTLCSEVDMSDENNDWGEGESSGIYSFFDKSEQGWETDAPDTYPVRFYEHTQPEKKERIIRWFEFLDR